MMKVTKTTRRAAGFSLIEISMVVLVFLVLMAISLPSFLEILRADRLSGDARGLAHQLTLARQRAGTEFTWAEITVNTSSTPNSYKLKLCTTKGTSSCTTYTTEGGAEYLSSGISFGFGNSSGAAGGQSTAAQTTTIIFNSRGVPVDSAGSPIATDTIYLSNDKGEAVAVSLTLSGHPNIWRYSGGWVSL